MGRPPWCPAATLCAVMIKRAAGRWLAAAAAAAAVLPAAAVMLSGCASPVDPAELPGVYRNDETGGEIVLEADGTFSATDVSAAEATLSDDADPLDFHGRWEYVDSEAADDFCYLEVDGGDLGGDVDIQLYTRGDGVVELHPDPDGPISLTLTKAGEE